MKRKVVVEPGVKTFLRLKSNQARDKIHLNYAGFLKVKKLNIISLGVDIVGNIDGYSIESLQRFLL